MANKFILIIAALILVFASANFALADECSRSGNTMLITYSPNDLNVGEEFNLNYYDLFGGANQQVTLNIPSFLTNLGDDTVTLIDDGLGGGYWTWQMNSTRPGNHTVYININYEEGGCNITKIIEIKPALDMPNILLDYSTVFGDLIANQNREFNLLISNAGFGTAYNITGWTNLGETIDTFSYSTIDARNSVAKRFDVNTDVCGILSLESVVNYQDNFGYNYPPSHVNKNINVVGSDLEITDFDVSDTSIKRGKILEFEVTIKNIDRSTTINAGDAVIKIYRDDELIETINFGNVEAGSSVSKTGEWKVRGKTGKATIKAIVNSNNECSNWDNDETVKVQIYKEDEDDDEDDDDGSGDSGGAWPGYDSGDDNEDNKTAETFMPETKDVKESIGAMAGTAIALELIVLLLVIIYLAKKTKTRKHIKVKQPPKLK